MMEALRTSETSALVGVARRNIPEDGILQRKEPFLLEDFMGRNCLAKEEMCEDMNWIHLAVNEIQRPNMEGRDGSVYVVWNAFQPCSSQCPLYRCLFLSI
jgi:hypothetical protein